MIFIIFWFTKNFIIKLSDFHPDILIEAILKKKACIIQILFTISFFRPDNEVNKIRNILSK